MEKKTKKTIIDMTYASSLGIIMVISIFGCLLIGAYLDRKFQTTTNVFTVLFLVIGIIAGFRNIYLFIRRLLEQEKREALEAKKAGKSGNDDGTKRPPAEKN